MFKKVRIELGQGYLDRYTLFENKFFFSVYFHIFNTIEQDRFHTHAFDGWAFLLRGGYREQVLYENGSLSEHWIGPGYRFIPKSYNHRLLRSLPNTMSLLITGPWSEHWTETNSLFIRTLTWGRKEVSRFYR